MHTRATDIAAWLREQVRGAGARGLVVGLDGSTGAAVVAGLCRMATPDDVAGVLLPGALSGADAAAARRFLDYFEFPIVSVDLAGARHQMIAQVAGHLPRLRPHQGRDARGEQQMAEVAGALGSRLGMCAVYSVAESLEYLVAGTRSRSDLVLGAFVRHGDAAADVLPLGSLLATEVKALAADLGLPDFLWAPRATEAPHGGAQPAVVSDEQLERYLEQGPEAVPPAVALRIERLVRQSTRRRSPAPTPGGTGGAAGKEEGRWEDDPFGGWA